MSDLNEYLIDEVSNEIAFRLIDLHSFPVKDVMNILLKDKTTGKNIIWATDAYASHGRNCSDTSQITMDAFTKGNPVILRPRIEKALEQQQERTRKKAEVFTPVWLCNKMNNYCDEQWFGRKDVFNHENEDNTWTVTEGKIHFPEGKTWQDYVDSRRLEITCGEAPYLVSRYDAATGEFILPPLRRIGILDRKLRIVNENAETEGEWAKWVERAYQSCYGYEWQGDSLLIARINLLMTYCDYCVERWGHEPDLETMKHIANVIAWNIWQMDGLKDTVPFGKPYQEHRQATLFDSFDFKPAPQEGVALPCKISNWRSNESLLFRKCKSRGKMSKKLFDFVIGNPPYHETRDATSDSPVYHIFMDAAYDVGEKVELITPGRFLFDAGKTPKAWNKKMIESPHLAVLSYVADGTKVFPGTEIKGGVAITYWDSLNEIGPIGAFTTSEELNSLLNKVKQKDFKSFSELIYAPETYKFTEQMHIDHPEIAFKDDGKGENLGILSKGHEYDVVTNVFDKLNGIVFFESEPKDGADYVKFIGRMNNTRADMYIKKEYVCPSENLPKYKVILAKSNGSGAFGEILSTPIIGGPYVGHTQTFLSIGAFDTENEVKNCMTYIKTKFARAMLGIKKVTQDNKKRAWEYVPLQDFTLNSDIDWSRSIPEIDQQLYAKYSLSPEEIQFIESRVQEMK